MATLEEQIDELLALAANAGRLGAESLHARNLADGRRDPRLTRRARDAAKAAETAEKFLSGARARFLARRCKEQVT